MHLPSNTPPLPHIVVFLITMVLLLTVVVVIQGAAQIDAIVLLRRKQGMFVCNEMLLMWAPLIYVWKCSYGCKSSE